MVSEIIYQAYCAILKEELVPAMGCTEPIAVAYAAAKAREVLGKMPQRVEIHCSANIVKNVKSVTVPNTGGLRGIEAAAIAGIISNAAHRKLEVLEQLTDADRDEIRKLLALDYCTAILEEGFEGLYIDARVFVAEPHREQSARVVIQSSHTGIVLIEKDGQVIYSLAPVYEAENAAADECCQVLPAGGFVEFSYVSPDRHEYALLNVRDIISFAESVRIEDVSEQICQQIFMNTAIAEEGLINNYGVSVGKSLLKYRADDVRVRSRAKAAAGSDARMAGCALPVVINSGSGNQGLTVSLPVIEYAKELGADEKRLIRALVISNLVALEQKEYIGKLSAYCGAVSAAVGSAAAIAWLEGAGYKEIAATITNAIATAGGILCDGAKSSCAAKIATALEAAIMAKEIGLQEKKSFSNGEGLVGPDVEATIRNVGYVGSKGMRSTDIEIMKLMLRKS